MWRDRTNLFISYRQSYSHHPAKKPTFAGHSSNGFGDSSAVSEERRGLMSAGAFEDDGDAVIEMDLLPPRWLDVQDEVTEYLTEISKQTRKLEQLHQKHILPGFDDEDVKREEEREIEHLTQDITKGFQNCQKAIQRIEMMVREAKQQGNISRGEEVMAQNLRTSLASRVGEASTLFRKKQSTYLKKLKTLGGLPSDLSRTASPMPNASYTLTSDPSLLDSDADRSLGQHTLLQTKQQRLQNPNDALIAQREREIEDIAKSIIDLANIFQEVQTMVIDQGSMLDRIDYNVERMATDVKEASKELTVASGYQRRSVKRKIMLLLIIVIAGMFILLGLKLSRKGSSSSPPPPAPANPPTEEIADEGALLRRSTLPTEALYRRASQLRSRREWHRRKRRLWDPSLNQENAF